MEPASPQPVSLGERVRRLEERDLQLWSILVLVLLVVGAGLAAIVLPNLVWGGLGKLQTEARYLPQLLFGFIALIVLFNVYILQQRLTLRRTREELIYQLLRSEQVVRASLTDPLTGTFNRRYLEDIFPKDLSRIERQGGDLTLLMLDLDDFKAVNTAFGHAAGDELLTEVGRLLLATMRNADTVVRYGGDEFLILLWETDKLAAKSVVTRLYESARRWNVVHAHLGYQMSFSCGLAEYRKSSTLEQLLHFADRDLYQQKAATRATG